MSESWTILRLIQWTTEYFKKNTVESPRLESEILLAHLLNLKRIDLYVRFEQIVTPNELSEFKTLIKRRLDQEPLAYIVGKKEFWSRDFVVTPDVLIPRPETELLVETVLHFCSAPPPALRAPSPSRGEGQGGGAQNLNGLEIGLGSGCIAITLLKEIPTLTMTAIEVSAPAVEIAKQNATTHGVMERLNIINANFLALDFTVNSQPSTPFDFIVSNPPYISAEEMKHLSKTVLAYEPHLALDGGNDGLSFYDNIFEVAKNTLKPGGMVAVEIGENQGYAVAEKLRLAGFANVVVKQDIQRHDRVVVGQHL